ncbi:hypothetical protein CHLNCDRAFT_29762 [Chlorella variabilis]|uniref:BING4 C-terminal domain-containing protein n=1 Tax=Chlorella variabilis TaxID=554065 RepID=E1Z5J2_CHLVA|nr:hypothetical protein CHLNCDRAFT_29762 [Chlorella variabilis]EFN58765.1 hypothetical protein CHLNCDRAFT_29762 [Chlorella variabilis]|eukprot:XP_005850867.1 hypothetical protein CHLNCDRAFT_29762 [Chlorella variabilis]
MERTWRFSQQDIVEAVDAGAGRKVFDLQLDQLGPYSLDFSRSGRHMLLAGRKGHLALMDWQRTRLICEVQVKETTHDIKFLHNEQFFAAAQKKYVYIYDKRGLEVHCLKDTTEATRLEFLPHHFLLCSVGATGVLRYQDTSTGQVVATHRTRQGACDVLRQNPWNGVLCLGHGNGTVTMWTPNITTPVVRMLCHHGPVRSLAADTQGRHLATTGADGQASARQLLLLLRSSMLLLLAVKVWDLRMLRPLHAYFSPSPAECCDISQRGLLAVGYGRRVQVWRDALGSKAQSPYMTHTLAGGTLRDLRFCPYEDVLGIGHSGGVSTMLVPGAGEPNYDSFVANPFQTSKQRREAEVHSLLDKLQPAMIVLDPGEITRVVREPRDVQKEKQAAAQEANRARLEEQRQKNEEKKRMKGKNKPSRRQRKKQANIVEERKPGIKARMREQGVSAEFGHKQPRAEPGVPADVPRALHRFFKK